MNVLGIFLPFLLASSPSPERLIKQEARAFHPQTLLWPQMDGFDVLSLDLTLQIVADSHYLFGTATYRIARLWSDSAQFMLDDTSFTVDSILVNGSPTPFSRIADTLRVPLPAGTTLVTIGYHGSPPYFWNWDFPPGGPTFFATSTEPYFALYWIPSHLAWDDKVDTVRFHIIVPQGWIVAANGLPTGIDTLGSWWTYHWETHYPTAPYLIHVSASPDYVVLKDTLTLSTDTGSVALPFWNFFFAQDSAYFGSIAHVPDMLQYFTDLFGLYPFHREKYGHASGSNGMENQTITAYWPHTTSPYDADGLLAHELAHQWWGDWITPINLDHLWLKEGFATWAQALYRQHRDSTRRDTVGIPRAYFWEMNTIMDNVLVIGVSQGDQHYPIVPPLPNYYNTNAYDKGACVFHMLRFILGDATLFGALRVWGNLHAYGNTTTDDLIQLLQWVSGQDLSWFFDPWLYQPGFPFYLYGWRQEGDTLVLGIRQVQDSLVTAGAPLYRMPLPFEIVFQDGSRETLTVWSDAVPFETHRISVGSRIVQAVNLDPRNWILEEHQEDPTVLVAETPSSTPYRRWKAVGQGKVLLIGPWEPPRAAFDLLGRTHPLRFRTTPQGILLYDLPRGIYTLQGVRILVP